jgi:NAD(P)H dehydrogenase (quinone)
MLHFLNDLSTKGNTMIVITGATGQLGRQVITALLKKIPANKIVAAVRNIEKAHELAALGVTVRFADYNQPAVWDAALEGAEKVLLISSNEVGQRVQQHQAVIDAARRAGVKQLVYTSLLHADTSTLGLAAENKATETVIDASGLPFTILRNGWYIENYAMAAAQAISQGAVYGCAGNGRISSASRNDYAEAAAEVLTSENHINKVYELAGDYAFTMNEFAATLEHLHGKPIKYVNLTEEAYKNALVGVGMPELFAALFANADTGIANGQLFEAGKQLSQLIGRPTQTLESVISRV